MARVVAYEEPATTNITKIYHFCQPEDNVLQVAQDLVRQLSSETALDSRATTIEQALESTSKVMVFIDGSHPWSPDIKQLLRPLYEVLQDDRKHGILGFKLFLIMADCHIWSLETDDILLNEVPAEGDDPAECYEDHFRLEWASE
ncbi:unnamed protein product [Alternaria alternata]